jgi:outer membrane protein
MKQLKTLAIAIVLFIGTQVSAQSKVAHIPHMG